jgi:hypothetical protein
MSAQVADTLERALWILRERGWCQGQSEVGHRVCVLRAIGKAAGGKYEDCLSANRVLRDITGTGFGINATLADWNDHPSRTFAEVESAFLRAIAAERAP